MILMIGSGKNYSWEIPIGFIGQTLGDLDLSKKLPFIFAEDSNSHLHTDNILNCKCVKRREIFRQNMSIALACA